MILMMMNGIIDSKAMPGKKVIPVKLGEMKFRMNWGNGVVPRYIRTEE